MNSASDAFQLHPDIRSYGTTLREETIWSVDAIRAALAGMCRADVEGGADVAHGDVAGARERAVASCARLLGDIARGAEDDETREDIASATEALRRATSLVVSSNANRGGDGGGGAEVVAAACGVLT